MLVNNMLVYMRWWWGAGGNNLSTKWTWFMTPCQPCPCWAIFGFPGWDTPARPQVWVVQCFLHGKPPFCYFLYYLKNLSKEAFQRFAGSEQWHAVEFYHHCKSGIRSLTLLLTPLTAAGLRCILSTVPLVIKASIQSTDSLAVFLGWCWSEACCQSSVSVITGLVEFWYFFQQ